MLLKFEIIWIKTSQVIKLRNDINNLYISNDIKNFEAPCI